MLFRYTIPQIQEDAFLRTQITCYQRFDGRFPFFKVYLRERYSYPFEKNLFIWLHRALVYQDLVPLPG